MKRRANVLTTISIIILQRLSENLNILLIALISTYHSINHEAWFKVLHRKQTTFVTLGAVFYRVY